MTTVSRIVSIGFESNTPQDSNMHQRKQIPCITSLLTRKIHFKRKGMTHQRRVWSSKRFPPAQIREERRTRKKTKQQNEQHSTLYYSSIKSCKQGFLFLSVSCLSSTLSFLLLFFCLHGSLSVHCKCTYRAKELTPHIHDDLLFYLHLISSFFLPIFSCSSRHDRTALGSLGC